MKNVIRDIKFMLGIDLGIYWKFCWGFLIPIALSFFFIYFSATYEQIEYAGVPYPDIAICKYTFFIRKDFHKIPVLLYRCRICSHGPGCSPSATMGNMGAFLCPRKGALEGKEGQTNNMKQETISKIQSLFLEV